MRQILSAPTHDTVDRRNRSALNKPSERLSLPVIELGRLACRLAVNQTIRPLGVETENPVTESYVRKLVTELSGGVFGYLDSVLERHSFDEFGELI